MNKIEKSGENLIQIKVEIASLKSKEHCCIADLTATDNNTTDLIFNQFFILFLYYLRSDHHPILKLLHLFQLRKNHHLDLDQYPINQLHQDPYLCFLLNLISNHPYSTRLLKTK